MTPDTDHSYFKIHDDFMKINIIDMNYVEWCNITETILLKNNTELDIYFNHCFSQCCLCVMKLGMPNIYHKFTNEVTFKAL